MLFLRSQKLGHKSMTLFMTLPAVYHTTYKKACSTHYNKKCHVEYQHTYETKYHPKCHTSYHPVCHTYYATKAGLTTFRYD